ncbi:MAG: choice-of-anchor B family protein [Bacteroidetes bacterium]|nr:choice-of-anchor B family protein [Bacteroidota bacterium]
MAGSFPCNEINLASNLPLSTFGSTRGADIWGWTDPQDGSEYALAAYQEGVAFVDVTIPDSPEYLGFLPTETDATIWRDVKVYQNFAFIVADFAGSHGMQIFDLTRLRSVTSPPETFTADAIYSGVGSAHNVVINEDSGFAYLVGSSDCSGGLHMVNIQNPTSPVFAGCFGADGSTHDAQCVTYIGPDTDYVGREICVGAQGTLDSSSHIVVVDVTDKANPAMVGIGTYADATYAHQGWFTEDHRYFLLGDEIDDGASATTRTMVFDMSDLENPELDFYYYGPIETTDHNLFIRGHYAFMSNYESGLRIVDIEEIDSGTMTEVAFFDTYPTSDNYLYNGQWSNYPYFESGNIIVNDRDFGLFVLTPTFPIGTSNEIVEAPGEDGYVLSSAYPNPFASDTRLTLTLAKTQHVQAEMLDITGRRVALLHDGVVRAGAPFLLTLTAASLPSGLYLVRVRGEHFTATRRVSLVH